MKSLNFLSFLSSLTKSLKLLYHDYDGGGWENVSSS